MGKKLFTRESLLELPGALEMAFYGVLGAALLAWTTYKIGVAVWATGSPFWIVAAACILALVLTQVVGDIRKRRFSVISGGLLGLWFVASLTVALVTGACESPAPCPAPCADAPATLPASSL